MAFFTSLKSLPLADATVIFSSTTFILTAASALFLKERVGLHRWAAVLIGFIGVVIALFAHYLFTTAFARADVSAWVVEQSLIARPRAPFEYTSLLWATSIGYLVWQDIPTRQVWIGASIIIACGLYVVHRESLRHRGPELERTLTRL